MRKPRKPKSSPRPLTTLSAAVVRPRLVEQADTMPPPPRAPEPTSRLQRIIMDIVGVSARRAWLVLGLAAVITAITGTYAARHFAIDADTSKLIAPQLEWRQRELAYDKAFPQRMSTILAVVDAPTSELAERASQRLSAALRLNTGLFTFVRDPGGASFFRRNGLLYLPTTETAATTEQLKGSQVIFQTLAADPTMRGALDALGLGLSGVEGGQLTLDQLAGPMTQLSNTLHDLISGRYAAFSWHGLMDAREMEPSATRRFIEVQPVLDYTALQPGQLATNGIRSTARELKLQEDYGASIRLTGAVAMADEEFGTLEEGAALNHTLTVLAVLAILWFALRSGRIILAVFVSLAVGFAVTAAAGLLAVGALNLISIAFAVLFIGLGVDFGLQFAVRYRAERHEISDTAQALESAGRKAGVPLALAAAAVAAAFWSFLPTNFLGLSELGLIAGIGMMVAFITSITVLPALIAVLKSPGEPHPMGYKFLAPVDEFMTRHRKGIIIATVGAVVAMLPLLAYLQFDFNPINLRSTQVESVATWLDLRRDPRNNAAAIEALLPTLDAANASAERVEKLPEVARVMTLASFVPQDQPEKLRLIGETRAALAEALNPKQIKPAPTDIDRVAALSAMAQKLTTAAAAAEPNSAGATSARRLSTVLAELANEEPELRVTAERAIALPLTIALADLRALLAAKEITLDTIPADILADWRTPDGRARLSVAPKGDPSDNDVLRQFARAVLAVEPAATGAPVTIQESGNTIMQSFLVAGILALVSIGALLWITLGKFRDVVLTLAPLLVATLVTLQMCVVFGMPLNFANIIALPLLLGVGVAFKIYYIVAWREGKTNLLQSTLTRAVTFSAMTTATAFGSLWLSHHPGTSSMGKLLALALVCTMLAAVLFQPLLMGPPPKDDDGTSI